MSPTYKAAALLAIRPALIIALLLLHPRAAFSAGSVWLGTALDMAVFIQWTERQGQLSGQLQATWIASDYGYSAKWDVWAATIKLQSSNRPFTGIRNGSSITLHFFDYGQNWTGTIRGKTLELVAPIRSGALSTLVLRPGTIEGYNQAVSSLYKLVATNNERAYVRAAVLARRLDLLRTLRTLLGDVENVQRISDFSHTLAPYPEILRQMEEIRREIRTEAARQPLSCFDLGTIQFKLGVAQMRFGSLELTNGSFSTHRNNLLRAMSETEETMAHAVATLHKLKTAVAADSTRTMTPDVLAGYESETWSRLKWADKELQAARTRLSNAEQSVRSYTERGRSLLNDMEALVRSLKCEG
jgi:hypothetical protein